MTIHRLKAWPEYYDAAVAGAKTFEVRRDDRGFAPGDTVILACWDPDAGAYDGREAAFRVPYVLHGGPLGPGGQFGVRDGFAVLSLVPVRTGLSGRPEGSA